MKAMERPTPVERLSSIEKLIADGRQRVEQQRMLVQKMSTYGVDDRAARELLDDLEMALALYMADRDDLVRAARRQNVGLDQLTV